MPTDTKYFTDTLTDIIELQNLVGIDNIVGCAWGYQGYSKLRKMLSERQILKNYFSKIPNILD